MIILCLILVSLGILINSAVGVYGVVFVIKRYNNLNSAIYDFVTPTGNDGISEFNKAINTIADIFAERYRIAMTATERGAIGAASRDLTRGLEEVAVTENPQLSLYKMMPKSLKKNPLAFQGLNIILERMMQSRGIGGNHSPASSSEPVKFKFDL